MSKRKITLFKCDALADLGECKTDNIAFVIETGKTYYHDGEDWTDVTTAALEEIASTSEAFPVGSVFISVDETNPNATLGYGTWASFGAGRTLVGFDAGQSEFDAAEKTGGAKTHTLTTAEMPSHTHIQTAHNHTQTPHNHTQTAHSHTQTAHSHGEQLQGGTTAATTGTNLMASTATGGSLRTSAQSTLSVAAVNQNFTALNQESMAVNVEQTAVNQTTGGGAAHNILSPFITVFFWKRTA